MKLKIFIAAWFIFISFASEAGSLANGKWQATGCGIKPPAPKINIDSVDAFNQSIKDINTWQAKAQEYYNCMVKEANVDNDTIAKSANAAQDEFKLEVNRIQKEAETAKATLEKN
jgi:hypothetical protein